MKLKRLILIDNASWMMEKDITLLWGVNANHNGGFGMTCGRMQLSCCQE